MQTLGANLFFFGIGSMILSFLNMEFVILAWLDMLGPVASWAIRILMAAIGAGLWLIARFRESA